MTNTLNISNKQAIWFTVDTERDNPELGKRGLSVNGAKIFPQTSNLSIQEALKPLKLA